MTKPNLLIVIADQLTGRLFPDEPAPFLQVPNLRRLARHALRFSRCYAASSLAGPAQAALLTGQMPRRSGVLDNACSLADDIPTFAHHLRLAGYRTALSGDLRLSRPGQAFGFEHRLAPQTAAAPAPLAPPGIAGNGMPAMPDSDDPGMAATDRGAQDGDATVDHAVRLLHDLARGDDPRPWCLTANLSHQGSRFAADALYLDLYDGIRELTPPEPEGPAEPGNVALHLCGAAPGPAQPLSPDRIRKARQAYFANISHFDARLGRIFAAIEETHQDATVVLVSDTGEMLGDRGLWGQMGLAEGALRVPLMISGPGIAPGVIHDAVSTVDLCPTLGALAGADPAALMPWCDGVNLLPMAQGGKRGMVRLEYAGDGAESPIVALRQGAWKYIRGLSGPDLLFDLEADPDERTDLTHDPRAAAILAHFRGAADGAWDLAAFDAAMQDSRARRGLIYRALHPGPAPA